jgi:hypothetical protein
MLRPGTAACQKVELGYFVSWLCFLLGVPAFMILDQGIDTAFSVVTDL